MPLLSLVLTLVVIGILLYCVETYIPMDAQIKQLIKIVVVLACVIWLLKVFGVWDYAGSIRIGP